MAFIHQSPVNKKQILLTNTVCVDFADSPSRSQTLHEGYPYDITVTRLENEGFGFVIISSVTRAGSTIGEFIGTFHPQIGIVYLFLFILIIYSWLVGFFYGNMPNTLIVALFDKQSFKDCFHLTSSYYYCLFLICIPLLSQIFVLHYMNRNSKF